MKRAIPILLLLACVVARAQGVFDMPRLFPAHRQCLAQFLDAARRGDALAAESAARAALKHFPKDPNWHYNVACSIARDGRPEEALPWLEQAASLGFKDVRQLERDGDLAAVRRLPGFVAVLASARAAQSRAPAYPALAPGQATAVLEGRDAPVVDSNSQWEWDPATGGYLTTFFRLMPPAKAPEAAYAGPCAELVRPWLEHGEAAGTAGWLYVNRDEDLADARFERFPLLTPVVYGEAAQATQAHKGAANGLFSTGLSPIPTVGNASLLSLRPPFWASIPRALSMESAPMMTAWRLAAANQLYVYDATPDMNVRSFGDLLTANHPAWVLSADLSGEEKLDARAAQRNLTELILAAVAAMTPETQRMMLRKGLLAPTVQRLLRQSLKGAPDYLSAAAHPAAFDPRQIDAEALVRQAHALTPADLPPAVRLAVRRDGMPRQFIDYFDMPGSERLADSPWCVARVVRGMARTRSITVEAASEETGLTYRWFVALGQADKVRVKPLTPSGSLATLEVDWHGAYEQGGMLRRRVDVACVAVRKDGTMSAPVFVSFRMLANERRLYDAQGRIASVDYRFPEEGAVYEDPALTALKDWRDEYRYGADGRLEGWTRRRSDGSEDVFDALGRRVAETRPDGSPQKVFRQRYFPRVQASAGVMAQPVELLQTDVGAAEDVH